MYSINVNLPQNPYNILIVNDGLPQLGEELKKLKVGKKVLVVSNPEIFQLYGEKVMQSLVAVGFEVFSHLIEAGESSKTLASVEAIYNRALTYYLERSSTMIALGGGVIGDMTGFAAATWLRGINFVQVPTTLLAMVDAAIGGKTGVNHPQGKNLIGAFYQPRLVLIDPLVLSTLPVREFRAGMAEVIKYGVIWDASLFEELEKAEELDSLPKIENSLLTSILRKSAQAKADVVSGDEKESGVRAILNYGHTIGHAVESLTGYTHVIHGEAVAIGMVAAGNIALLMGLWTPQESKRQYQLIQKVQLPTAIPQELSSQAIIDILKMDKKVKNGRVRFILPTAIGKVEITDAVTPELLYQVLG